MLDVQSVSGSFNGRAVIERLSFSVQKGEMFGIIGPNGGGKTTLMNMLTNIHPLDTGRVDIAGASLSSYSSRQLARTIAVLPQFIDQYFTFTVREMIALGRYPYQKGLIKQMSGEDERAIDRAMSRTDVSAFRHLPVHTLSGGEKQRVYLAQALAQEPELLFLDEPTNHLDINHQKNLLDSLQAWVRNVQLTVVAIFHDLNLASLYCDRLMLLDKGKAANVGTPGEVLTEERIHEVYGTKVKCLAHPALPGPIITMIPEKIGDPYSS